MGIAEPQVTKKEKVCFKLHGEDFTQIARDLMFERGWDYAIHLLMDALPGFTMDFAVDLLKGHIRLEGVNTVTVEKETTAVRRAHHLRIQQRYAGRVFDGKLWWEPYAKVVGWNGDDLDPPRQYIHNPHVSPLSSNGGKDKIWRSLYYMNDCNRDFAVFLQEGPEDYGGVVLWRQVTSPPVWMPRVLIRDWAAGLKAWLPYHKLDVRRGGPSRLAERYAQAGARPKPVEPPEYVPPPLEPPVEDFSKAEDSLLGWLSPEGKFYGCRYGGHTALAEQIVHWSLKREAVTPERTLEVLGWVKCGGLNVFSEKPSFWAMHPCETDKTIRVVPTVEQFETALRWLQSKRVTRSRDSDHYDLKERWSQFWEK